MSTIRKIITKAFREAGIIQVGTDPDAPEFEEALDELQGLYSSLFGNELGDQLTTVDYGALGFGNSFAIDADQETYINGIYVPENIRLILNVSSTDTVFLYPNPMDGARFAAIDNAGNLSTFPFTVNANGRRIDGSQSVTLSTNSSVNEWFYRADLGQWTKITDLAADDESPLPREFDKVLQTGLAVILNPRYGAQLDQQTVDIVHRMTRIFRARYRQISEQHAEDALIRLPSNKFWRYRNSSTAFYRGRLA